MKTAKLKALLIDLEGTLYFKEEVIYGANDTINELRKIGLELRFLTNTDSKSTSEVKQKLDEIGLISINENEIFTPFTALTQLLIKNEGKKAYFLLNQSMKEYYRNYTVEGEKADYVVVGDFRDSVDYNNINYAFQHIMEGSEIIALQKGRYFIRSNGYNIDTGAFVSMLEYASGKSAKILGKPSSDFFNLAFQDIGCSSSEAMIIGDDITTDITGAANIGSASVLVKTGKYSDKLFEKAKKKPDIVINSIIDVLELLRKDYL